MPGVTAASTVLVEDSLPSLVPQRASSASAESNFRELDDAYLQTQARIWLGEMLQIRFDEQTDISDLLADGELLYEVSEVISRMLPVISGGDESQIKVYDRKTLATNKSTQRYMPYYNVDSFLRMCKDLGMDGIDLFTPSDVVERRNTRKVCMCLRSLSKKSRLRDLNVPDFDSVTCTLAMPTDMVEGIRKSLEMSQSSSSLSAEQEVEKISRVRVWRRMSNSASIVSNGYSDNCDEAESRFVVAESCGTSDYAYDAESPNISGSQLVRENDLELQLSTRLNFKTENDDQYMSPSKAESVGSPCSQYYNDEVLSVPSSNGLGSRISDKVPVLNSETNHKHQIGEVRHIPIDWGDHLDVGNYKDANANDDEVDCVSHNKEDVDATCSHNSLLTGNDMINEHLGTSNNPSKVDCDKSSELDGSPQYVVTDDFHSSEAPYLSHEDASSDNNATKHEPYVVEVGPNISELYSHGMTSNNVPSSELLIQSSCVSKPSEIPEFLYSSENKVFNSCTEVKNVGKDSCCYRLNNGNGTSEDVAGSMRFHEEQSPCSVCDGHSCICSSLLAVKPNGIDDHWMPASLPSLFERDTVIRPDIHCSPTEDDKDSFDDYKITSDHTEKHSDNGVMDDNTSNLSVMTQLDLNSSPHVAEAKNSTKCSKDCRDAMKEHEGFEIVVDKPIDIDNAILYALCNPQPEAQSPKIVEDTDHKNLQSVKEVEKAESEFEKQEGTNKEIPVHKPQRKLLKSVVKGTALLGVAVFLLHLRKNRRENLSEAKKRPTHMVMQGTTKPSQKGQKSGSTSSVYPAEKLHLGK